MRIPTITSYTSIRNDTLEAKDAFYKKQLQVTTGQAYLNRSEDPGVGAEVAEVEEQQRQTLQFQDNVREGLNWIKTTASSLEQMTEIMQNAKELVTASNTGINPPEFRQDQGDQLDSLIEQALQVSTNRFGSTYLFGGTATDQEPFTVTRDADGRVTNVAYNGDVNTEKRKTQFDGNTSVDYGELAGGTDGLFEATNQGIDIFANLIALRDELLAGDPPSQANGEELERGLDHVIGKVTENGVKQKWFETRDFSLISIRGIQENQIGSMRGVDMARAMTELNELQTAFQASLQMITRTDQMSVLNFI